MWMRKCLSTVPSPWETEMKLWIDDLRPAPVGWVWAKTSQEAIDIFTRSSYVKYENNRIDVVSFDHDLGGSDTSRRVVLFLCEYPELWPETCRVHSANPVGVEWLTGMIGRYGPGTT